MMRTMNKAWFLILSVVFSMYLCRCSKDEAPALVYKGIVVYNVCGNVVIQASGADKIGEDGWTDTNDPSKPVYDHIFKVANPCEFGGYSQGDTISFVVSKPKAHQCMQCEIYVATPVTSYPIKVVK